MTRLTTVRLDDFGFGTHWRGCDKGWELVVMHHESRFRLGFMTADLQSASRDNSQRKWWRWRVTLPHETACKAGAFLVEPHPQSAQWHAALVLPQAWVVLETYLCWLARGITAVSNGAASRLRSGFSALAMPCRS